MFVMVNKAEDPLKESKEGYFDRGTLFRGAGAVKGAARGQGERHTAGARPGWAEEGTGSWRRGATATGVQRAQTASPPEEVRSPRPTQEGQKAAPPPTSNTGTSEAAAGAAWKDGGGGTAQTRAVGFPPGRVRGQQS